MAGHWHRSRCSYGVDVWVLPQACRDQHKQRSGANLLMAASFLAEFWRSYSDSVHTLLEVGLYLQKSLYPASHEHCIKGIACTALLCEFDPVADAPVIWEASESLLAGLVVSSSGVPFPLHLDSLHGLAQTLNRGTGLVLLLLLRWVEGTTLSKNRPRARVEQILPGPSTTAEDRLVAVRRLPLLSCLVSLSLLPQPGLAIWSHFERRGASCGSVFACYGPYAMFAANDARKRVPGASVEASVWLGMYRIIPYSR